MIKLAPCLLLALTAACVDDPTLGGEALDLGPGGGNHEQGRYFLGRIADELPGPAASTYYAAAGTSSSLGTLSVIAAPDAGTCLGVTVGLVSHTCADPIFTGAVIQGPGGARPRFRIVSSTSFVINQFGTGAHPFTGYRVEHNASWPAVGAPTWQSYCVDDRLAYPMAGQIRRSDGVFIDLASAITFACSEYDATGARPSGPTALSALTGHGVVAKAMSWKYVPGADGVDEHGAPVDGVVLHQGAVAAGRAAYCSDGVAHTLDATSIKIFDFVHTNLALGGLPLEPTPISQSPIDSTQYAFESVWGYEQAVGPEGITAFKWFPICLSRLRWQSLPTGDRCASTTPLVDPRVQESEFCDDMTIPELIDAGGLVGVYSQWNDLGLWRWKNASGDYYSTSVGAYGGASSTTIVPDTSYTPAGAAELQGTLMTSKGKELFLANYLADAGTFVEIKSCRVPATGEWVTGRNGWLVANGFSNPSCKSEGHVWATRPTAPVLAELGWTMRELKIWTKGSEHATSVTAPPTYTGPAVASVGWVVAPATW